MPPCPLPNSASTDPRAHMYTAESYRQVVVLEPVSRRLEGVHARSGAEIVCVHGERAKGFVAGAGGDGVDREGFQVRAFACQVVDSPLAQIEDIVVKVPGKRETTGGGVPEWRSYGQRLVL